MSSSYGTNLKVTLFGESHGEKIGVVIDGISPGIKFDYQEIEWLLQRRKPGQNKLTTQRNETDIPNIVSGVLNGVSTGTPICAFFENSDTHCKDYSQFKQIARPGHTDYTGFCRYNGFSDVRGGGHFSARITTGLVFAGALAKQVLAQKGIAVCSHISQIGTVKDILFDLEMEPKDIANLQREYFPLLNKQVKDSMEQEVLKAKEKLDSVGGQVECIVLGLPAGLGDPFFDSVESKISQIVFSIPAVKAIEFGAGVASVQMCGSEHNPRLKIEKDRVVETTNHNGGILGGITNGMPLVFRTSFKPTPSIAKEQQTVNFVTNEQVNLQIKGRHDPCVALRATPIVEAAAAIALLDILLGSEGRK